MRTTFTGLRTAFENYTQTTANDASSVTDFRDRELNNAQTFILGYLKSFLQTTVRTTSSVADQQYYSYPVDAVLPLLSAVYVDGNQRYPLQVVEGPDEWNRLNAIQVEALSLPQFVYPRARDFGLYPTPQDSDDTIELEFNLFVKDMSNADYTTGTVTVTTNSATVTGSGTTFASWMAGAWFKAPDGLWYRIESFDSTTQLTLETVFEGSTASGQTYTVGESPNLPPELIEIIPHYAAAKWFGGPKKDLKAARYHHRMFWTGDPDISAVNENKAQGGLLGARKRYASRSDSSIVHMSGGSVRDSLQSRSIWGETLSI